MVKHLGMGTIIAFSGTDGAGKSTQIWLLEERLRKAGARSVRFWSRGGYTPVFSLFKTTVRKVRGQKLGPPGPSLERSRQFSRPWVRRVWLCCAIFDLFLCYGLWLRWKRWTGYIVICDRYLEDTLLDFKRNFPGEQVGKWFIWRLLCKFAPKPDYRFLLIVPPGESQRRSAQKDEPFPDTRETLEWRYARYQELAGTGDWIVLDCLDSPQVLHAAIMEKWGQPCA